MMRPIRIACAVAGLGLVACVEPSSAVQATTAQNTELQNIEMSAAQRTVRRRPVVVVRPKGVVIDSRSPYYLKPGVKPSFGYIGPPGFAGEYAWRKSIGQCVEDLGYGRWAA